MATSNRDYVGRALETLAEALDPFIERVVAPHLPDGITDWAQVVQAKDAKAGKSGGTYERTDPQLQLRIITEPMGALGYLFNGALSRTEQGYAGELRAVRNDWAHNKPFSGDQARRALETIELLLRPAGAVREADTVRRMRLEIQRAEFERETRRSTRSAATTSNVADAELPSWRDVLTPHPDVASGDFASSEFAADLYRVAVRDTDGAVDAAPTEYSDAIEFFRRTYLTDGLRELLQRSAARLAGNANADAVINLQTTFGGGKTHSMLAVWHLFSGRRLHEFPQDVQDVLVGHHEDAVGTPVKRVTIVGNEIAPGQPTTKPDGTVVHTLWGEIAWQLGDQAGDAASAYAYVAEADRTGTNPGGALRDLFAAYGPAVILIDEWVSYARQLNTRRQLADGTSAPLPAGDFDTQFTFAQSLTQAAAAVPGVLLLVSIPASERQESDDDADRASTASDIEVGGSFGREALERLDNIVRRVAYQWAPAARDESYEIVRRRLFVQPNADQAKQIAVAARRFREFYQKHTGEFPSDVTGPDYEARIRASYPVHPELLDRLYAEWSTLEKFQRTRGVLRLMSTVIHQLWAAEDPAPLILPGTVPLGGAVTRRELVQYLPHGWDAVLQNDVDGEDSVARRIDRDRPALGNRSLTVRTARTVLIDSAPTVSSAVKGVDRKRLTLGLALPGDVVGNIGSALTMLADRSSHFYVSDDRYWYDTQASLNRTAANRALEVDEERVHEEVVARLRRDAPRSTQEFAGVVVAPTSTGDVADEDSTRLVLLHPRHVHNGKDPGSSASRFALELLQKRGTASRTMPNSIVMLAADSSRWNDLDSTVRSYLAWKSILDDKMHLDLTPTNEAQAQRQVETTNRTIGDQIAATWIWGLHATQPDPGAPFGVGQQKCEGQEKRLAQRVGARFVREDLLRVEVAPRLVRMDINDFLLPRWNTGKIRLGELWEYYARYPYMPRLRDKNVLIGAVQSALHDAGFAAQGFALAQSYDETTGSFDGLAVPIEDLDAGTITDDTLLVKPDLAITQRRAERAAEASAADADTGAPAITPGASTDPAPSAPAAGSSSPPVPAARPVIANASYVGRVEVDGGSDLPSTFRDLVDEVLLHLQQAGPDVLDITVDIRAERSTGFEASTVRVVGENSRQLRFTSTRFTDG
ncbi:Swt1 family HEPN domain-containing protein [Isoptericola sp. BMS4]|uniref:Swt1 family HEPN domain-containing protein n=1 Tax=Isoptericola sp. BMS4 TaxID=2527875 RepID=UPI0014246F21|nr:Swt1 family HEPN domain-containing protein [Isoptericola sp. BMS4]